MKAIIDLNAVGMGTISLDGVKVGQYCQGVWFRAFPGDLTKLELRLLPEHVRIEAEVPEVVLHVGVRDLVIKAVEAVK